MALSGWNPNNKLKLTIDGSKIEGDLTDFPVNITLSSGTGINSYDASTVFDGLTASGTDSYTKVMLHMDDVALSDSSYSSHTTVLSGSTERSDAQAKFNNYSGYFDGASGSVLTVTGTRSDWDFGTNDFTIEWWEYRVSVVDGEAAASTKYAGGYRGFMGGYYSTPNLVIFMSSDGANWDIASYELLGSLSLNTWVHFAVVRFGNVFYAFKNGVQQSTWSSSEPVYFDNADFVVGANRPGYEFHGYIDEFRISKGIARWTSNFTPPQASYEDSWWNRKKIAITDLNDNQFYTEIEYWNTDHYVDVTDVSYTHYSDNSLGDKYNMSDNDLSTYVQNYTYCAIDFGSPGKKIIKFRIAVHNSTARTNFIGKKFQGSNNSTNGSDGDWIDLTTFTSDNFGIPGSYPGFGNWITISGSYYEMYRLTGVADNNNVINEWEMLESVKNPLAVLWTRVPTIASGINTDLYLYYDTTVSGNTTYIGDTGDSPAQNVWDNNFIAVYHMSQDPSIGGACILDSTSNTEHGTPGGSMNPLDLVDGQIGNAIDLDGTDDYINLSTGLCSAGLSDELTVETCFYQRSYPAANLYTGLISKGDAWLTNRTFIFDLYKDGATNALRFSIGTGTGNAGASASYDVPISYSTNYYAAGKYDGSTVYLYLDDSQIDTTTYSGGDVYESSVTPVIGGLYTGDNGWSEFDGIIDEVRLSKIARSAAWIKATYYSNWNDLITFAEFEAITFIFSDPIPSNLSTVYGITQQLYLTTTVTGAAPSYIYDAGFYNAFDDSLINTASGVQSGSPANMLMLTPSGINYQWYVTATSSGSQDTSSTYTFTNKFLCEGQTQINDVPASGVPVRLYRRSTGEYIGDVVSFGVSGTFEIETDYNEYHYVIALYNSDDTNAIIADWLTPNN